MSDDNALEFAQVYAAYHGKVVAYATRLVGRDTAEDIAQEVFLKVRRSLGTLRDGSKLPAWLHTITLNAIRDAVRRRSLRPDESLPGAARTHDEVEPAALAEIPDVAARTPEEASIRREMVTCYLELVNELRPTYRDVFVLSEFEHLANDEVAMRLGVSVGTVKIRLHRARARIAEQLRRRCRCYYNERGELMATRDDPPPA